MLQCLLMPRRAEWSPCWQQVAAANSACLVLMLAGTTFDCVSQLGGWDQTGICSCGGPDTK